MTYEQVICAEIFQALKCEESNLSFASSNGGNQQFKLMFPDSMITQNYSQYKVMVKCNILFGIAPYVKEILIKDVKGQRFSFKFDKTVTRQVEKSCDAYIWNYSKCWN